MPTAVASKGLEGIVATSSSICWIDGDAGVLSYRGISFWLPQIIKDLGVNDVFLNGLVTSIPFAVSCVAMIIVGRSSDKTHERKWHIIVCSIFAALGLVGGASLTNVPVLALASLSIGLGGALSSITVLWVLPSALLTGAAAAAAGRNTRPTT